MGPREVERVLSKPHRARLAVAALFFANGFAFANWVTRIPQVQHTLRLSDAKLGFALFGVAAGSLVAMPLVGLLVASRGSAGPSAFLAAALCASLPLPGLAPNFGWLAAALVLLGAANGGMDVAMNSQAAAVERAYGAPIMASFHGVYSCGGLVGALMGGVFAAHRVGVLKHLAVVGLVLAAVVLVSSRFLLSAERGRTGPFFGRPDRALLGLAILAFCVLLGEGAVADWSAVFMVNVTSAGPDRAALAFAAFSLFMAIGRFAGDYLTRSFGPVTVVRTGAVLAALGLGCALVVIHPSAAVVGFACVGAGFSCIFPSVVSAAARSRAMAAGTAIATVATAGYGGFLAGPPVIGLLSEASTLRVGLGVVVALSVLLASLASAVRP